MTKGKNTKAAASASSASTDTTDVSLIDTVKELLADLKQDILSTIREEIKSSMEKMGDEIHQVVTSLEEAHSRIDDLNADNRELNHKVNILTSEIEQCKERESMLSARLEELLERQVASESYSRRENLLIYGLQQEDDENCHDKLLDFMKNKLLIPEEVVTDVRIQRCHRLNTKSDPKPIICRFLSYPDRMTVWAARFKLKGTSLSMSEDFPQEIAAKRRMLYPVLKAAQKDKVKCRLVGDRLELGGKSYTTKTLHLLPARYNPAKLATVEKNGVTAFFTKASPLSNFHPSEFRLDGYRYSNVEQYFQEQKAIFCSEPQVAARIRATTDPAKCKSLGDQLQVNVDEWSRVAMDAMKKACQAKFTQNSSLKGFLLGTGGSTLVEASRDKYWGAGLPLSDPDVFDTSKWRGSNCLGKVLETIRKEL